MRTTLSALTATGVGAALLVLVFSSVTPTTTRAAKGGKGGGGDEEQTPAKITFDDSQTGIRSDGLFPNVVQGVSGGSYEGFNDPNGTEVFIGSQGNLGNIFMRTNTVQPPPTPNVVRDLDMTLPANSCGLPAAATTYDFHFANVTVNAENGLFGIQDGETHTGSMKIRFFHDGMPYFITFDVIDKGKSNCKGQSSYVQVERLNATQWRVFSNGELACIERNNTSGKDDLCVGGQALSFSYIIEDISTP